MIDARQIPSTRAFYWLPMKTGFELSKFQNVRLMSVVLNNANLYEEKGSSAQSFLRRKCELLTLSNVNVKWR